MRAIVRRAVPVFVAVLAVALLGVPTVGQEKSVRPGINDPFKDPDLKKYLGVFEGESREIYAERAAIVNVCKLKPGMAVADIGAGTGLFTRLFAKEVGEQGRVYAVDIAPRFIDHIEKTSRDAGLKNVHGVVCTPSSAELPPNSVDVAFICDTYHHFEFPQRTMASIHRALRPGGQLVLIDFHRVPGKSREWILGHVRAGQEVFTREVVESGFRPVDEHKFLKENYVLRFEKVPAREEKPTEPTQQVFTYKKTKQADLQIHVHYPPDWKTTDKRPAIVFFFGGGWTNGNVRQFERQAEYLASRGMLAARADYRVKSRHAVTPADCVEDAKSAVRWLRKQAPMLGIDPERIVAAGGSAGGHIAACTALSPGLDAEGEPTDVSSKPNALLLFNPVLRFDGVEELMKRIDNDEKRGVVLSPTLHVTRETPPAMLFFGNKDRLLPQGEEYVARSKDRGNRAELLIAEGQGHGYFNRSPWQERTLRRADEFLGSLGYLKGEPTLEIPSGEQKP